MKKYFFFLGMLFASLSGAQEINPALLSGNWSGSWITCPGIAQRDYGVYHFRKTINLDKQPAKFTVHVSADNRYRLFVNGKAVCNGPARGDLYNWYFETVDIAPYLKAGGNIIAALVWNMGVHAPVAQVTNQTAFLLQGNTDAEKVINTNNTWKVYKDTAYTPCSTDNGSRLRTYMVIGPGDHLNAAAYPWGWEQLSFNDAAWLPAIRIASPVPVGYGSDNLWTLQPRNIPLMREELQRISSVRRSVNMQTNAGFLQGNQP